MDARGSAGQLRDQHRAGNRPDRVAGISHLGIQVEDETELAEVYDRLTRAERPTVEAKATTCCYAKSDKQWIADPQGVPWETFFTYGEATVYGEGSLDRLREAKRACRMLRAHGDHGAEAGACKRERLLRRLATPMITERKIMNTTDIKETVRVHYGSIADAAGAADCCAAPASCCGPSSGATVQDKALEMGYSEADLAAVPDGANLGLGCGNPQAIAALQPGEVVIDLGSGAGFDCFLAAQQVGPQGHVIGVDMTHEMLKKARENAAKIGAENVEFRLGELEHLPVADNTANVILSNCVINLVPDKRQVFREAFRALKPGGRLAISDIVNSAPLPADLEVDSALICGCIAGAATVDEIETWLSEIGFVDVRVTAKEESRELIKNWAPGRGVENYVVSAIIEGRKPSAP